jgi:hypothetical protein
MAGLWFGWRSEREGLIDQNREEAENARTARAEAVSLRDKLESALVPKPPIQQAAGQDESRQELERMRRASAVGQAAALAEGLKISREMLAAVADRVQGVQVSAPLGRVPVALEVIQAAPIEPLQARGYNHGT